MFLNVLQVVVQSYLMLDRLLYKVSKCFTGDCTKILNVLQVIVQSFLMFYRLLYKVTYGSTGDCTKFINVLQPGYCTKLT